MDWVKTTTDYYLDIEVATLDDAAEVMFTRGNALAGRLEADGFIPDALLHTLTRRPKQASKFAAALVQAGLWDRVAGGYQIVNFVKINDELTKLVARKRRDRDRKRAERRSLSADTSEDKSADSPTPRPTDRLYESERKSKNAAAAASLPPVIDILRSKLQAHTALAGLRFDTLNTEQTAQLEELVAVHGDARLAKVAVDTCRTPPPVNVSAFLGTWRALPAPGQVLRDVTRQELCAVHNTVLSATGRCAGCRADEIAGVNA